MVTMFQIRIPGLSLSITFGQTLDCKCLIQNDIPIQRFRRGLISMAWRWPGPDGDQLYNSHENLDIAIAMSPSRADPVLPWLGVFKYLYQCLSPGWEYLNIYISVSALTGSIYIFKSMPLP